MLCVGLVGLPVDFIVQFVIIIIIFKMLILDRMEREKLINENKYKLVELKIIKI